jgi:hypothetical protein
MTENKKDKETLTPNLSQAIRHFWRTRELQIAKQRQAGQSDQGARGAVTGGAQMDGVIVLLSQIIMNAGIEKDCIFIKKKLELPGFFRPTKEWDILVIKNDQLIIAIETKSHVGPSFGNNFNNRTEEAMGSALDLWTAFREGAFNKTVRPWLGYFMLLEASSASQTPVKVKEPHFKVLPEFVDASYEKRYELFCRKLVRERHYNAAAFITSEKAAGLQGGYREPAEDISFINFHHSLHAHAASFCGAI